MSNKKESTIFHKNHLLPAVLIGLAFGFSWFFFGVTEVFAGNRAELMFSLGDFIWPCLGLAIGSAALVFLLLTLTNGTAYRLLKGIFFWLALMGYVQSTFLGLGSRSLKVDDGVTEAGNGAALNTVIWAFALILCLAGAFLARRRPVLRTVSAVMMIMVLAMQLSSFAVELPTLLRDPFTAAAEDSEDGITATSAKAYLSTNGLTSVSPGKNIIIFILDRFDHYYYDQVKNAEPDFFAPLTGFTYYSDNISLYSRTMPGIATLVSGQAPDLRQSAEAYFREAYRESPLLKDLKANDYRINLYVGSYYSYRSGDSLAGIADNLTAADSYRVTDPAYLFGNMVALSAYKALPEILKSSVDISTAYFTGLVEYEGGDELYELNDGAFGDRLRAEGLSLDGSKNGYTFIHMNGCHSPFVLDENGYTAAQETNSKAATMGSFRLIYLYLEEMKRLGVYEDATIIITGDHPSALDDYLDPTQPRITSLFVKRAGKATEPLAYSAAQVSQENLSATLVKSAGLQSVTDYGRAYWEIPEGENTLRHHRFELWGEDSSITVLELEINGPGNDFSNWTQKSRTDVGRMYD